MPALAAMRISGLDITPSVMKLAACMSLTASKSRLIMPYSSRKPPRVSTATLLTGVPTKSPSVLVKFRNRTFPLPELMSRSHGPEASLKKSVIWKLTSSPLVLITASAVNWIKLPNVTGAFCVLISAMPLPLVSNSVIVPSPAVTESGPSGVHVVNSCSFWGAESCWDMRFRICKSRPVSGQQRKKRRVAPMRTQEKGPLPKSKPVVRRLLS